MKSTPSARDDCQSPAFVSIENLHAGYGQMEILHDVSLRVGRKQSLCLIGPNGAGKSTVLHAIFGFNNIFSGRIRITRACTTCCRGWLCRNR